MIFINMNRLFSLIAGTLAMVFSALYSIVDIFKGNSYGSSKKGKR